MTAVAGTAPGVDAVHRHAGRDQHPWWAWQAGEPVLAPGLGWVIRRHADVRAVLQDPRCIVPPAPPGAPPATLARLRGSVSRFANGREHAKRRALIEDDIVALAPAGLRDAARAETLRLLKDAGTGRFDVMAGAARRVPVAVLCDALGVARGPEAVDDVIAVAAAYHPGADQQQQHRADAAVRRLMRRIGSADEAAAANRIGLLVQACDATAGLIGNALNAALRLPADITARWPIPALLSETLRHDPPVWNTRRRLAEATTVGGRSLSAGATVVLHLAAANRDPEVFVDPHRFDPGRGDDPPLTFGFGLRPCPGQAHALALAAGVVTPLMDGFRLADPHVELEPSPNLRIPARLEVTRA